MAEPRKLNTGNKVINEGRDLAYILTNVEDVHSDSIGVFQANTLEESSSEDTSPSTTRTKPLCYLNAHLLHL